MKLIIVKSDKPIPVLHVVTAVSFDIVTDMITLNRAVPMAEGDTDVVSKDHCFEYDVNTYEAISGLLTTGQERIAAALQMIDNELEPAKIFVAEGQAFPSEEVVRH